MKGRLVAFVGIFCVTCLIVSGAYADKPPKKPKPPKPGNITTECIVFTGDLESVPEGGTVVEGCCPNAGPWPAYTMAFYNMGWPYGPHEGQLFAKSVTTRVKGNRTERYKVQFWTWDWDNETPGTGDYFFQIYSDSDDIVYDETTDVLTVTVDDGVATGWEYHNEAHPTEIVIPGVSFVLEKTSDLTHCPVEE